MFSGTPRSGGGGGGGVVQGQWFTRGLHTSFWINRALLTHPASPSLFFSIRFASAISQVLNLATEYTIFRPPPFFETLLGEGY